MPYDVDDARRAAWSFCVAGSTEAEPWDWVAGPPLVTQLTSVRRARSHDRSSHVPVRAFCCTTGSVLGLESGLEHDWLRKLDRDRSVVGLVAQPARLEWRRSSGRLLRHVPDLLSVTSAGEVTLWDARPLPKMDEKLWRIAELTKQACHQVGWSYRLVHELGTRERLNLIWLSGYRHPRPWYAIHRGTIVEHLNEGSDASAIGEVLSLDDGSGELIATMWHLMWCGDLEVDLEQSLDLSSTVRLRAERVAS